MIHFTKPQLAMAPQALSGYVAGALVVAGAVALVFPDSS